MTPAAAALAGLLAGLFGSTHCVAMCGGIMAVLHGQVPRGRTVLAAGFHVGRISSYLILAMLLTLVGSVPAQWVPADAGPVMRIALGALLVLMAAYIALPGRLRDIFGDALAPLTRRVLPLFQRTLPASTWERAIGLGLLWGLLPCGLLYSVLAAVVLLADPAATLAMVIGFGLGTLPLLLGGGLGLAALRQRIRAPWLRLPAATVLALTGVLVSFGPGLAHRFAHPAMQFVVDCVSA